jgi:sarcosine oxidase subunit gamma
MLIRESTLKDTSIKNYNNFDFEELSNTLKINLRGDSNDRDFITNAQKTLNALLPIEPNTCNGNDKLTIIWLSPNEWLIEIYEKEYYKKIFLDLNVSLNAQNTAITDVTENRTILKITGDNLYKLLSKFMIIDLDKILKKKLAVAQTIFIKAPVLIVRNHDKNEKQSINMYTNRSHAQYIIDLLLDGSKNINF